MKLIRYLYLFTLLAAVFPQKLSAQNILDLVGLNETATTSAAYSVRKLSSSYNGNAIKVRRSSDNTTQDIGFTSGGDLDVSTLLAFAGSGNAFVNTWYDQSGNVQNLTQANSANQPRIVSSGSMDLENSKPFIRFFGLIGNSLFNSLNLATEMTTSGHIAVVNKFATGGDGFVLGHTGSYYWHSSPPNNLIETASWTANSYKDGKFWQNGVSVAANEAVFNTNLMVHSLVPRNASSETIWNNIGSDRNYYHNTSGGGGYSELIVFASELNMYSRNVLTKNQGDYFGISISAIQYLNRFGQFASGSGDLLNRNGEIGISGIIRSGESVSHTLLDVPQTAAISSITSYSAMSGGTILSDKGATLKAGVCWSTSASPTIGNSKTIDIGKAGSYTSRLTGLRGNTVYYLRSYATNNLGTRYGNELSFTTGASVKPIFSASSTVSSIFGATAIFNTEILTDGGEPITEKGICWSIVPDPTVADARTIVTDPATGTFSNTITGLSLASTYYARAYASNSVGTTYSSPVIFTSDILVRYTETTIPFETYFDFETATTCTDDDMCRRNPAYDLRFAAGGGSVRARMWWNEQYADMALVYDKIFDQLNASDIARYYYCEHINDGNIACVNKTDTPPIDFIGIYKTNSGNYYAVKYVSEDNSGVTFQYRKLN